MGDIIRVEWNQLCPAISKDAWQVYNSAFTSAIFNEGICTQTYLKSARGYNVSLGPIDATLFPCVIGEILYCSYEIYPESDSIWSAELGGSLGESIPIAATANNWTRVAVRITASKTGNYRPLIADRRSASGAVNAVIKIRNAMSVNLTQMFGTGNEPNLEEFEAQCALNGIDLAQYQAQDSGTERDWIIPHYNQQMMERKKQILINSPHIESINNSIASFKTDMIAPLKSAKVHFEPKQDLHGYDKPWVGGSGKNLIGNNFITDQTINNSGEVITNIGGKISDYISVSSVSYVWSGVYKSTDNMWNHRVHGYDENKNWIEQITYKSVYKDDPNFSIVFTPNSNIKYIRLSFHINTDENQVEIGSTATSYEPYENICPIKGSNNIELELRNKNLVGNILAQTTLRASASSDDGSRITGHTYYYKDTSVVDYVKVEPGESYTCTFQYQPYSANGIVIYSEKNEDAVVQGIPFEKVIRKTPYTFTIPDNGHYLRMSTINLSKEPLVMIEKGVIATDYITPDYRTITVTFPSEAETIYGGYIDLIKGELVETCKRIALSGQGGSWTWNCYTISVDNINVADGNGGYNVLACSHTNHKGYGSEPFYSSVDNVISISQGKQIRYRDNSKFTDLESAQAYIQAQANAGTPVQLVAKLATPITYTIDPISLKTLRGINNIWSDAGPVEVQYWTH